MKRQLILGLTAALFASAAAFGAVTDEMWGEAWNSAIGTANYTITGYAYWSAIKTGNTRGSAYMLFDGTSNLSGNDYITTKFPGWAKLVISDTYEEGRKFVLKKYRIDAASTENRRMKAWKIYGCDDPTACFTSDGTAATETDLSSTALALIDSRSDIASTDYTNNSYTVDISSNTLRFRSFVFVIESDNGANFCQIGEWYLFGEVSADITFTVSGDGTQYADGSATIRSSTASDRAASRPRPDRRRSVSSRRWCRRRDPIIPANTTAMRTLFS